MRARRLEQRVFARLGLAEETVTRAREQQRQAGGSLGEILAAAGAIPDEAWGRAVALELNLPFRGTLDGAGVDPGLLADLPMGVTVRRLFLPLGVAGAGDTEALEVAFSDLAGPDALGLLEDLRLLFSRPIAPVLAPPAAIREAVARAYDAASQPAANVLEGLATEPLEQLAARLEEPRDLLDVGTDAPLVRFVNALLAEALSARASDIHLEPFEHAVIVRFRIDGTLQDVLTSPRHLHAAVVSRLKVMAGLDIAERRLPQDGRMRLRSAGRDVDVRVSTVPTIFGERTVLRLLDQAAAPLALEQLGLRPDSQRAIERLLGRTHGIVLATGPTGSGKTTTLYAALSRIAGEERSSKNIITIEDPVEYQLPGVGQMQINTKIALTFAQGLRSVLRQDPDVIMVGEIRDRETAEIAIHAALTGHLVLSTLHTTDSIGALTRLLDMGIEPFLVSSAVTAIIGQRLVRRVCDRCRVRTAATGLRGDDALAELATVDTWTAGPGCASCRQTGYRGRTGIYELLRMDDAVRALVMKRSDAASIRRHMLVQNMRTLRDEGIAKVLDGITTVDELLRVTRDDAS
jgi:general secretion pathway protein E